jgi:hypothetical protein
MSKKDDEHSLSCVDVIFKLVKKMQAWENERIKKIVTVLPAEGIKISVDTDIWYSYSYVCTYFLQYTF